MRSWPYCLTVLSFSVILVVVQSFVSSYLPLTKKADRRKKERKKEPKEERKKEGTRNKKEKRKARTERKTNSSAPNYYTLRYVLSNCCKAIHFFSPIFLNKKKEEERERKKEMGKAIKETDNTQLLETTKQPTKTAEDTPSSNKRSSRSKWDERNATDLDPSYSSCCLQCYRTRIGTAHTNFGFLHQYRDSQCRHHMPAVQSLRMDNKNQPDIQCRIPHPPNDCKFQQYNKGNR